MGRTYRPRTMVQEETERFRAALVGSEVERFRACSGVRPSDVPDEREIAEVSRVRVEAG